MALNIENISRNVIIGPSCKEQFLPLQLPQAEPLRRLGLTLGGISQLKPPYRIARHRGLYHTILCTTAGAGTWQCGDDAGTMTPGSVWLFPARAEYHYAIADANWDMHWLHMEVLSDWGKEEDRPRLIGSVMPGLEEAMQGLIREEHSTLDDTSAMRTQYVKLLISLMGRLLGDSTMAPATDLQGRLSKLWQTVAADLRHPWSVEQLARELHVSPGHLHRLTRDHHQSTPMQCVTRQRMEYAGNLLQNTDYPLYVIADRVGYQTPFSFSKAFKRFAGKSPRAYRKQNR